MKKKYKRALAAAICVVCAICAVLAYTRPVEAETELVQATALTDRFTVQGSVSPQTSVVLNAGTAGTISELPFREGMQVRSGETVVRIDGEDPTANRLQREQVRQQLATAQQAYDSLFGENGAAQARLASALAAYELADQNFQSAAAAADSYSKLELSSLEAKREAARQEWNMAQGVASEANRTHYLEQIDALRAQIAVLDGSLGRTLVSSPHDGVIWELSVDVGAHVEKNQPVAKLYSTGSMMVTAELPAEDAIRLAEGGIAECVLADGSAFPAQITFLSPVAQRSLSAVGLEEKKCLVELTPLETKLPEKLGAGYPVDVTFSIEVAEGALSVPASAIVPVEGKAGSGSGGGSETGEGVYVIRDGRAAAVMTETGRRAGGRVEIISGLKEGERIVSDPYDLGVKEGTRVRGSI